MNLAQLFVKLGLAGDSKFTEGVKKADQALKGLVSGSFLAKAGITVLGASLLKASQVAGQFGLNLSMLQTRTGLSAQNFQKFAYAGELAGIKTEETMGVLSSLQKQMDEFSVTGEGPQWLNEVMKVTNGDLNRVRDTVYLFGKLQQYATSGASDMQKRLVLGSFGLSDNMIAALMKGAFGPKMMAKALKEMNGLSSKQIETLTKINTEWSKLSWNIKQANAQLVAIGGETTVSRISVIADKLYKAAFAFVNMIEKSEVIKSAFDTWMSIIEAIIDNTRDLFDLFSMWDEVKPEHIWNGIKEAGKDVGDFIAAQFSAANDLLGGLFGGNDKVDLKAAANGAVNGVGGIFGKADQALGNLFGWNKNGVAAGLQSPVEWNKNGAAAVLQSPAAPVMNKSSVINSSAATDNKKITINQTNNFTNADDNPQQIAQATTSAVNDSFKGQTTAAMRGMVGTGGGI